MYKKLFFVGLLGVASVAYSWSSDSPEEVFAVIYQPYIESLKLHYEFPAGCADDSAAGYGGPARPNCALAADFNGDGSLDYAALFDNEGTVSPLFIGICS